MLRVECDTPSLFVHFQKAHRLCSTCRPRSRARCAWTSSGSCAPWCTRATTCWARTSSSAGPSSPGSSPPVRWVCFVSDIVQRWSFVSWLITTCPVGLLCFGTSSSAGPSSPGSSPPVRWVCFVSDIVQRWSFVSWLITTCPVGLLCFGHRPALVLRLLAHHHLSGGFALFRTSSSAGPSSPGSSPPVRWVCFVSDIVQRWSFVSWLITTCPVGLLCFGHRPALVLRLLAHHHLSGGFALFRTSSSAGPSSPGSSPPVRWVCFVSDIVQRWSFVSWLITTCPVGLLCFGHRPALVLRLPGSSPPVRWVCFVSDIVQRWSLGMYRIVNSTEYRIFGPQLFGRLFEYRIPNSGLPAYACKFWVIMLEVGYINKKNPHYC
jgi:hypothetical protein